MSPIKGIVLTVCSNPLKGLERLSFHKSYSISYYKFLRINGFTKCVFNESIYADIMGFSDCANIMV